MNDLPRKQPTILTQRSTFEQPITVTQQIITQGPTIEQSNNIF